MQKKSKMKGFRGSIHDRNSKGNLVLVLRNLKVSNYVHSTGFSGWLNCKAYPFADRYINFVKRIFFFFYFYFALREKMFHLFTLNYSNFLCDYLHETPEIWRVCCSSLFLACCTGSQRSFVALLSKVSIMRVLISKHTRSKQWICRFHFFSFH